MLSKLTRLSVLDVGQRGTDIARVRSSYFLSAFKFAKHPGKTSQRLAIIKYLCEHHDAKLSSMRLLSLPGPTWIMERQLQAEYVKPVQFCAVERDLDILRYSVEFMPGNDHEDFWIDARQLRLWGVRTESALLVHADLLAFLSIGSRMAEAGEQRRGEYAGWCKRRTAIALDFSGPYSRNMHGCLLRLAGRSNEDAETVPVCITAMLGRGVTSAKAIADAIDTNPYRRAFVLDDQQEHDGLRTKFLTAFGRLIFR